MSEKNLLNLMAQLTTKINAHAGDVTSVCFWKDGFATASNDKTIRLWNLYSFEELDRSPLRSHKYGVHYVCASPDSKRMLSASTDGKCILWSLPDGNEIATFEHSSKASIRICKFSPSGKSLVTGCDDLSLCLWNISSGSLLVSYEGHDGYPGSVGFSPDGNYIISGSTSGDLRIWDAVYGHGKCFSLTLDAHDLGVTSLDFCPRFHKHKPDTKVPAQYTLATSGSDNLIKLWKLIAEPGTATVQLILKNSLLGHKETVMMVCYSTSGQLLASASGDKTARLWDVTTGTCLHVIEGHSRYVTSCAFSLDDDYLATGSNDKTVLLWRLVDPESLSTEEVVVTNGKQQQEKNGCNNIESSSSVNVINVLPSDMEKKGSGVKRDEVDVMKNDPIFLRLNAKLKFSPQAEMSFLGSDVSRWTVPQVCLWLVEVACLGQYTKTFAANAIDGEELITLTHESLRDNLKIEPLGHRNKILRNIDLTKDGSVQSFYQQIIQTDINKSKMMTTYYSTNGEGVASSTTDNITSMSTTTFPYTTQNLFDDLSWFNPPPQSMNSSRKSISTTTPTDIPIISDAAAKLSLRSQESLVDQQSLTSLGNHLAPSLHAVACDPAKFFHAFNNAGGDDIIDVPHELLCPITRELFYDPVVAVDGFTYERSAITDWIIKSNNSSPMTNEPLSSKTLIPNLTLKKLITRYLEIKKHVTNNNTENSEIESKN